MARGLSIALVLAITLSVKDADASECCGAYTDRAGTDHKSKLCPDYCCLRLSNVYKECCNDPLKRIPAKENHNADCSSTSKHILILSIVGGVVGLVVVCLSCFCACKCHRESSTKYCCSPVLTYNEI